MVRIDRNSGRRVFGSFPTKEDPKSAVIWEAFKPETEPRRSIRRAEADVGDDPVRARPAVARRAAAPARPRPTPRREAPATAPADDFLQRQGGVY
jgi:penicillin-binding protein 1A